MCYNAFMEITSRNNKFIQELKEKTKSKSFIVLDTPKLVEDALGKGKEIETILILPKFQNLYPNAIIVNQSIIDLFSSVETNAGIIAFVKNIKPEIQIPKNRFLVLDNVQDPGNVGTLIRSALGADFLDVYLVDCASVSNQKLIRSSMGSIFAVNTYELSLEEFINFSKQNNLNLIRADMEGENIYNIKHYDANVGIVMGNEGKGVRPEIEKLCSKTIKIPMLNNLESINVAVSGSIIMYQITFGGERK